ncbi:MAG: hypothetical protein QHI48_11695, partial [Bacteroidota bacterium]|nr:hypothetical protein [Bacteroidota bacterium]
MRGTRPRARFPQNGAGRGEHSTLSLTRSRNERFLAVQWRVEGYRLAAATWPPAGRNIGLRSPFSELRTEQFADSGDV